MSAILLCLVPIFLHTVYSVKFCWHRCQLHLRLSYVFKMLSVDWYVRNRIPHVHPVSNSNSRCRLGLARHSANAPWLASPVCISSCLLDMGSTCQILYISNFAHILVVIVSQASNNFSRSWVKGHSITESDDFGIKGVSRITNKVLDRLF